MHKRKLVKQQQEIGNEHQELKDVHDYNDDDDDDDNDDLDYDLDYDKSKKNCNNTNKYLKPNYEYYSSESEHDHCSKKSKKNDDDGGGDEVLDWNEKDSNLDVIVNAVLDELRSTERVNRFSLNNDNGTKSFSHEIDQYLKHNHTRRNSYLTSNESFQKKLKKLMKSV